MSNTSDPSVRLLIPKVAAYDRLLVTPRKAPEEEADTIVDLDWPVVKVVGIDINRSVLEVEELESSEAQMADARKKGFNGILYVYEDDDSLRHLFYLRYKGNVDEGHAMLDTDTKTLLMLYQNPKKARMRETEDESVGRSGR